MNLKTFSALIALGAGAAFLPQTAAAQVVSPSVPVNQLAGGDLIVETLVDDKGRVHAVYKADGKILGKERIGSVKGDRFFPRRNSRFYGSVHGFDQGFVGAHGLHGRKFYGHRGFYGRRSFSHRGFRSRGFSGRGFRGRGFRH